MPNFHFYSFLRRKVREWSAGEVDLPDLFLINNVNQS